MSYYIKTAEEPHIQFCAIIYDMWQFDAIFGYVQPKPGVKAAT